jgi:hypothetical protein
MKRLLQIVALAVIGIVAGQPVLAGFTCTVGMSSVAPHCSRAMQMGMACHHAQQAVGLQCRQGSCQNCSLQDAAQFSAGAKPKTGTSALPAAFHAIPAATEAFASRPPGPPALSAPDRCVLFQVFRI